MDWNSIYGPAIVQLVAIVTGIAITTASAFAMKKWGIDIEEKDRNALHSAIITGLNASFARKSVSSGVSSVAMVVTPTIIAEVIGHINKSVPDATKRLQMDTRPAIVLENLIRAKAQQVLGRTSPVVSPPTG